MSMSGGGNDDTDSDDGLSMAELFTQDLNIEESFEYEFELRGRSVTVSLGGIQREFGQTILGSGDGTGLTIWRGAEELSTYLAKNPDLVHGRSCLELGAGLGLVGLTVAHLGAAANVVTDGDDDCLKRLASNALKNGFVEMEAEPPPSPAASLPGAEERSLCDGGGASSSPSKTLSTHQSCRTFVLEPNAPENSAASARPESSAYSSAAASSSSPPAGLGQSAQSRVDETRSHMTVTRLVWSDSSDIARASALTAPFSHSPALPHAPPREPHLAPPPTAAAVAARFDVILAADVIYQEEAISPLVATVCSLLKKPHITLSHKKQVEDRGSMHRQGAEVGESQLDNSDGAVPKVTGGTTQNGESGAAAEEGGGGIWILSFARRNVPVQKVLDEATQSGLICRRLQEFSGSTEGIFEFSWRSKR